MENSIFYFFLKPCLRVSFRSKIVQIPKLILGGGQPISKSPKFTTVPTPLGGGCHLHFGPFPKLTPLFSLETFPYLKTLKSVGDSISNINIIGLKVSTSSSQPLWNQKETPKKLSGVPRHAGGFPIPLRY